MFLTVYLIAVDIFSDLHELSPNDSRRIFEEFLEEEVQTLISDGGHPRELGFSVTVLTAKWN